MGYPMEKPPRILFGSFKASRHCNAKTRRAGLCQNMPMGNGRCRMHGGASPHGEQHPRYTHGRYSKYKPLDVDALIAKWNAEPPVDLSAILADMGEISAMLADLGEPPNLVESD